ncbi:uncharacterized protein [Anolis sagrei]|uniref:uncharacterized protein isoform X2 n=1 Tax=Anolis sagrei TaxID=38937 RepID=UPI0035202755
MGRKPFLFRCGDEGDADEASKRARLAVIGERCWKEEMNESTNRWETRQKGHRNKGSFGDNDENAKTVTGIVGESVAFQLMFSSPFETITWLRTKGKGVDTVGILKQGEKCLSIISLISLQGRLNVSEDCKTIEILHLQEEDSATFRAQVQIPEKKELLNFLFRLQVFRHLLDSDVQIHCKAIGNETWRLNCYAGELEEGVTFQMVTNGQKEHSGRTLDVYNGRGKGENLTISCTARNPISTASSTQPLWDLCGTFGEEDENAENVTGTLGESVAFQLKFSSPFEIIAWQRMKGKDVDTVGVLKPGEKCLSIISLISLQGRLNVSEDCKKIEILRLQQEDSATFRAQVPIPQKKKLLIFLFHLQVFRHLLNSDVQIHCKAIGNETWRLDCSAGESEEGVTFQMVANGQKEHSGRTLDVHDGRGKGENLNISCTARNPISTASSTRPLRDLCGSFGEEDKNVENVIGILGESVAFQLKLSSPFETITWQKTNKKDFDTVGVLKPGEKCLTIITLISLQGRLNVSEDCKKIEILRLQQEDSATFRAQVPIPQKKKLLIFLFHLQVFRHLLDSDVQIHCKAIGNETWRLNCSAGESEEGVTFQMVANGQKEHSGRTLDVYDGRGKGENLNISCTARNPISTASSTRPLRDLCGTFGEEDENVENVIGILGESVAFQLKFSSPFEIITWQRTKGKDVDTVGVLKPGEKCLSIISLPSLHRRLNVSEDCKTIEILRLKQEDSATFKAQIQLPKKKELLIFLFRLQVFRSFGEEDENAQNVPGILGESVTFQLKFSSQFETITWQRRNKKDFDGVAVSKPGEKCLSIITLRSLQGRLNVSEDCKKIEILRLKQEDSATFRAQVQIPEKEIPLNFFFHLQVFRHLRDSDVQIHCKAIGNETWRLNCSAGESEEGVTLQMGANGREEHFGRLLDVQDGRGKGENLTISCTARNPISTASSAWPLRDLCEEEPSCGVPSWMMVARFVAGAVVALLCAALLVWHNTGTG